MTELEFERADGELLDTEADTEELTTEEEQPGTPEAQPEEAEAEEEETTEDGEIAKGGDAFYERLAMEDLLALKREFHEAKELNSLSELDDPVRFAELRELGLTPREAYLATKRTRHQDNRRHLSGAAPRGAGSPRGAMTQSELLRARELFSGMSDKDIQSLFKRVSG